MLTRAQIATLKPRAVEYEIEDGQVRGLKLRVHPSGVKSWVVRYFTAAGRRRIAIGRWPDLSLAGARAKGSEILTRIAKGEDPSADKAADREAMRMVDLFGITDKADRGMDTSPGWYLGEYVRHAGANDTAKTPRSVYTDRLYIRAHLRERKALMRKRVDAVTLADLDHVKADCKPGAWRKVRDILRIAFRHAQSKGQLPQGPTVADKTTKTADKRCERFLDAAERVRLEAALASAEQIGMRVRDGLSPGFVRLFRLLALSGMRLGEALDLRWEQIDFRHGLLRLPTSKTGAKSTPVTPQCLAFLKAERGSVARVGRVCATAEGGRLGNFARAWGSVRRNANLPGLRIHDLRHSWASDAAMAGVPLHVIGAVLGHRSTATTARYAHLADTALRDGLAKTGDAIERATSGVS